MKILRKLLKIKSISTKGVLCGKVLKVYFKNIGFQCKEIFVNNVYNIMFFNSKTIKNNFDIAFSGHIDVVNEGNITRWKFNPYSCKIKDNKIYGRGICDMKASIICYIKSLKRFIKYSYYKNYFIKKILLMITGDEEGKAEYGTKLMVNILKKHNIYINYTIVGEPTSTTVVCDTIKASRRGSINMEILLKGHQLHTAYSYKKTTIFNNILNIYNYIKNIRCEKSSISITDITTNNNYLNIIPGQALIRFNIRYNNIKNYLIILNKIKFIKYFNKSNIYIIQNIHPYRTNTYLIKKIISQSGLNIKIRNNSGGTSDGRFVKKISKTVFEMGMLNKKAHCYNEYIKIVDYFNLIQCYNKILNLILLKITKN